MVPEDCEAIRPLLPRVADGEASPAEAMETACHLSDCTACRILLARERRLAEMLEEDWDGPSRFVVDNCRVVEVYRLGRAKEAPGRILGRWRRARPGPSSSGSATRRRAARSSTSARACA